MLTAIIILVIIFLVYLYLIVPDVVSPQQAKPFIGVNFAHRGLYSSDGTAPENSMAAFMRAINRGCGIELDIRLTADNEVVVFHDETLSRICGVDARVDETTFEELSKLRIDGTDEKIPKLSQVLELIDGRVPLIVEIKHSRTNSVLCEKSWELLSGYNGKFCIQSFDPTIVGWYCKNAPTVYRGQLVSSFRDMHKFVSLPIAFAASNIILNFYARPNFISHSKSHKSLSVRICEFFGTEKLVWTVSGKEEYNKFADKNDSVIFERFIPKNV